MARAKRPFFISFEGIDQCGKKTQALTIKKWLESKDVSAAVYSEPHDDTPIGSHIRAILQKKIPFPGDLEMQRLFTVDRAQGWHCFIKPDLDAGIICLLERYALSTLAYSKACGLSLEKVLALQCDIVGPTFKWPDLTFLIDISPTESLQRIALAAGEPEHFEKLSFLSKVRDAYKELSHERYIGKIARIDGERPVDKVTESIKLAVCDIFDLF